MALTIGDRAPEIALEDQDGVLRRRDELHDKVLVLFFYPKDDTPGCTAEACAFRDTYSSFEALGAAVWGVSSDDAVSHRKFAQRYQLPFPLLVIRGNACARVSGFQKFLACFQDG